MTLEVNGGREPGLQVTDDAPSLRKLTQGSIVKTESTKDLLLELQTECQIRNSKKIAEILYREIKAASLKKRRSADFVKDIYKKLLFLHGFHQDVKEKKKRFPYSKILVKVVVEYIQLEHNALYAPGRNHLESEKEVESRIINLIENMFLPYDKKPVPARCINPNSLFVLKVLYAVASEYRSDNNLFGNLVRKLLKKLHLWDTVKRSAMGVCSITTSNPAVKMLSLYDINELPEEYDTDDEERMSLSYDLSKLSLQAPIQKCLTASLSKQENTSSPENSANVKKSTTVEVNGIETICLDDSDEEAIIVEHNDYSGNTSNSDLNKSVKSDVQINVKSSVKLEAMQSTKNKPSDYLSKVRGNKGKSTSSKSSVSKDNRKQSRQYDLMDLPPSTSRCSNITLKNGTVVKIKSEHQIQIVIEEDEDEAVLNKYVEETPKNDVPIPQLPSQIITKKSPIKEMKKPIVSDNQVNEISSSEIFDIDNNCESVSQDLDSSLHSVEITSTTTSYPYYQKRETSNGCSVGTSQVLDSSIDQVHTSSQVARKNYEKYYDNADSCLTPSNISTNYEEKDNVENCIQNREKLGNTLKISDKDDNVADSIISNQHIETRTNPELHEVLPKIAPKTHDVLLINCESHNVILDILDIIIDHVEKAENGNVPKNTTENEKQDIYQLANNVFEENLQHTGNKKNMVEKITEIEESCGTIELQEKKCVMLDKSSTFKADCQTSTALIDGQIQCDTKKIKAKEDYTKVKDKFNPELKNSSQCIALIDEERSIHSNEKNSLESKAIETILEENILPVNITEDTRNDREIDFNATVSSENVMATNTFDQSRQKEFGGTSQNPIDAHSDEIFADQDFNTAINLENEAAECMVNEIEQANKESKQTLSENIFLKIQSDKKDFHKTPENVRQIVESGSSLEENIETSNLDVAVTYENESILGTSDPIKNNTKMEEDFQEIGPDKYLTTFNLSIEGASEKSGILSKNSLSVLETDTSPKADMNSNVAVSHENRVALNSSSLINYQEDTEELLTIENSKESFQAEDTNIVNSENEIILTNPISTKEDASEKFFQNIPEINSQVMEKYTTKEENVHSMESKALNTSNGGNFANKATFTTIDPLKDEDEESCKTENSSFEVKANSEENSLEVNNILDVPENKATLEQEEITKVLPINNLSLVDTKEDRKDDDLENESCSSPNHCHTETSSMKDKNNLETHNDECNSLVADQCVTNTDEGEFDKHCNSQNVGAEQTELSSNENSITVLLDMEERSETEGNDVTTKQILPETLLLTEDKNHLETPEDEVLDNSVVSTFDAKQIETPSDANLYKAEELHNEDRSKIERNDESINGTIDNKCTEISLYVQEGIESNDQVSTENTSRISESCKKSDIQNTETSVLSPTMNKKFEENVIDNISISEGISNTQINDERDLEGSKSTDSQIAISDDTITASIETNAEETVKNIDEISTNVLLNDYENADIECVNEVEIAFDRTVSSKHSDENTECQLEKIGNLLHCHSIESYHSTSTSPSSTDNIETTNTEQDTRSELEELYNSNSAQHNLCSITYSIPNNNDAFDQSVEIRIEELSQKETYASKEVPLVENLDVTDAKVLHERPLSDDSGLNVLAETANKCKYMPITPESNKHKKGVMNKQARSRLIIPNKQSFIQRKNLLQKTIVKPRINFKPNEFKGVVGKQSPHRVYDATYNIGQQFSSSEDSCDSFKDNLIIAEETTKNDLNKIFEEDSFKEKLVTSNKISDVESEIENSAKKPTRNVRNSSKQKRERKQKRVRFDDKIVTIGRCTRSKSMLLLNESEPTIQTKKGKNRKALDDNITSSTAKTKSCSLKSKSTLDDKNSAKRKISRTKSKNTTPETENKPTTDYSIENILNIPYNLRNGLTIERVDYPAPIEHIEVPLNLSKRAMLNSEVSIEIISEKSQKTVDVKPSDDITPIKPRRSSNRKKDKSMKQVDEISKPIRQEVVEYTCQEMCGPLNHPECPIIEKIEPKINNIQVASQEKVKIWQPFEDVKEDRQNNSGDQSVPKETLNQVAEGTLTTIETDQSTPDNIVGTGKKHLGPQTRNFSEKYKKRVKDRRQKKTSKNVEGVDGAKDQSLLKSYLTQNDQASDTFKKSSNERKEDKIISSDAIDTEQIDVETVENEVQEHQQELKIEKRTRRAVNNKKAKRESSLSLNVVETEAISKGTVNSDFENMVEAKCINTVKDKDYEDTEKNRKDASIDKLVEDRAQEKERFLKNYELMEVKVEDKKHGRKTRRNSFANANLLKEHTILNDVFDNATKNVNSEKGHFKVRANRKQSSTKNSCDTSRIFDTKVLEKRNSKAHVHKSKYPQVSRWSKSSKVNNTSQSKKYSKAKKITKNSLDTHGISEDVKNSNTEVNINKANAETDAVEEHQTDFHKDSNDAEVKIISKQKTKENDKNQQTENHQTEEEIRNTLEEIVPYGESKIKDQPITEELPELCSKEVAVVSTESIEETKAKDTTDCKTEESFESSQKLEEMAHIENDKMIQDEEDCKEGSEEKTETMKQDEEVPMSMEAQSDIRTEDVTVLLDKDVDEANKLDNLEAAVVDIELQKEVDLVTVNMDKSDVIPIAENEAIFQVMEDVTETLNKSEVFDDFSTVEKTNDSAAQEVDSSCNDISPINQENKESMEKEGERDVEKNNEDQLTELVTNQNSEHAKLKSSQDIPEPDETFQTNSKDICLQNFERESSEIDDVSLSNNNSNTVDDNTEVAKSLSKEIELSEDNKPLVRGNIEELPIINDTQVDEDHKETIHHGVTDIEERPRQGKRKRLKSKSSETKEETCEKKKHVIEENILKNLPPDLSCMFKYKPVVKIRKIYNLARYREQYINSLKEKTQQNKDKAKPTKSKGRNLDAIVDKLVTSLKKNEVWKQMHSESNVESRTIHTGKISNELNKDELQCEQVLDESSVKLANERDELNKDQSKSLAENDLNLQETLNEIIEEDVMEKKTAESNADVEKVIEPKIQREHTTADEAMDEKTQSNENTEKNVGFECSDKMEMQSESTTILIAVEDTEICTSESMDKSGAIEEVKMHSDDSVNIDINSERVENMEIQLEVSHITEKLAEVEKTSDADVDVLNSAEKQEGLQLNEDEMKNDNVSLEITRSKDILYTPADIDEEHLVCKEDQLMEKMETSSLLQNNKITQAEESYQNLEPSMEISEVSPISQNTCNQKAEVGSLTLEPVLQENEQNTIPDEDTSDEPEKVEDASAMDIEVLSSKQKKQELSKISSEDSISKQLEDSQICSTETEETSTEAPPAFESISTVLESNTEELVKTQILKETSTNQHVEMLKEEADMMNNMSNNYIPSVTSNTAPIQSPSLIREFEHNVQFSEITHNISSATTKNVSDVFPNHLQDTIIDEAFCITDNALLNESTLKVRPAKELLEKFKFMQEECYETSSSEYELAANNSANHHVQTEKDINPTPVQPDLTTQLEDTSVGFHTTVPMETTETVIEDTYIDQNVQFESENETSKEHYPIISQTNSETNDKAEIVMEEPVEKTFENTEPNLEPFNAQYPDKFQSNDLCYNNQLMSQSILNISFDADQFLSDVMLDKRLPYLESCTELLETTNSSNMVVQMNSSSAKVIPTLNEEPMMAGANNIIARSIEKISNLEEERSSEVNIINNSGDFSGALPCNDTIDVDDPQLAEKVKSMGFVKIGSESSDHDYINYGGPLLVGKYEQSHSNESPEMSPSRQVSIGAHTENAMVPVSSHDSLVNNVTEQFNPLTYNFIDTQDYSFMNKMMANVIHNQTSIADTSSQFENTITFSNDNLLSSTRIDDTNGPDFTINSFPLSDLALCDIEDFYPTETISPDKIIVNPLKTLHTIPKSVMDVPQKVTVKVNEYEFASTDNMFKDDTFTCPSTPKLNTSDSLIECIKKNKEKELKKERVKTKAEKKMIELADVFPIRRNTRTPVSAPRLPKKKCDKMEGNKMKMPDNKEEQQSDLPKWKTDSPPSTDLLVPDKANDQSSKKQLDTSSKEPSLENILPSNFESQEELEMKPDKLAKLIFATFDDSDLLNVDSPTILESPTRVTVKINEYEYASTDNLYNMAYSKGNKDSANNSKDEIVEKQKPSGKKLEFPLPKKNENSNPTPKKPEVEKQEKIENKEKLDPPSTNVEKGKGKKIGGDDEPIQIGKVESCVSVPAKIDDNVQVEKNECNDVSSKKKENVLELNLKLAKREKKVKDDLKSQTSILSKAKESIPTPTNASKVSSDKCESKEKVKERVMEPPKEPLTTELSREKASLLSTTIPSQKYQSEVQRWRPDVTNQHHQKIKSSSSNLPYPRLPYTTTQRSENRARSSTYIRKEESSKPIDKSGHSSGTSKNYYQSSSNNYVSQPYYPRQDSWKYDRPPSRTDQRKSSYSRSDRSNIQEPSKSSSRNPPSNDKSYWEHKNTNRSHQSRSERILGSDYQKQSDQRSSASYNRIPQSRSERNIEAQYQPTDTATFSRNKYDEIKRRSYEKSLRNQVNNTHERYYQLLRSTKGPVERQKRKSPSVEHNGPPKMRKFEEERKDSQQRKRGTTPSDEVVRKRQKDYDEIFSKLREEGNINKNFKLKFPLPPPSDNCYTSTSAQSSSNDNWFEKFPEQFLLKEARYVTFGGVTKRNGDKHS